MKRRILIAALALCYLYGMAHFAFRPFRPILGVQYAPAQLEWNEGAVHLQRGAALEVHGTDARARKALVDSGQMSIELVLQTDTYDQPGTPIIAAFGQNCFNHNFALTQDGNGIELRLRTMLNNNFRIHPSFLVPRVLHPGRKQHLVLTYNGELTRLYVDGAHTATTDEIVGHFDNWGKNHVFTLGDEPPGGDAWFGCIWRYSLFDRALTPEEVKGLHAGGMAAGPLFSFDFSKEAGSLPDGMERLHYRNLFVSTDPAAYEFTDCIFNIIGFIPLGVLAYMMLPLRMERRKILAGILVPILTGLVVSGIIEWLQRYVYMRVPCAPDLMYNAVGALLGGLLAWLAFSTFKNKTDDGSRI